MRGQQRSYKPWPIPLSMSQGTLSYLIDFIKSDGAIISLEVSVNESEARVLGEAWVSGHDVAHQIMDGVAIQTILKGLATSEDLE